MSRPTELRLPEGVTPARVFGLVGTSVLLGIGLGIVLVIADGGEAPREAVVPVAVAAATPEPTAKRPRRPPMSARARAARRAAVQTIREQGYTPVSLRTYRPDRDVRVLLAAPSEDPKGGRRAFFFFNRRFVGTDTDTPSARLTVRPEGGERWATLAYRLYRDDDRACCPRGKTVEVRYDFNGAALVAKDPQPDPWLRVARR